MKIIQILIGPDNSSWQGNLFGLGDDGRVYVAKPEGWTIIQDDRVVDTSQASTELINVAGDDSFNWEEPQLTTEPMRNR